MSSSAYTVIAPGWPQHTRFSSTEVLRRPPGYLDGEQRAHLTAVAEKPRMSHDLSLALAVRYAVLPAEATAAPTRELAAVRRLLGRYELADPNAGLRPGRFTDSVTQSEYNHLLAHGETGPDGAVAAAAESLRQILDELDVVASRVHAPDVRHAYRQLSTVAGRRLRTLRSWGVRHSFRHGREPR